MITHEEMVAAAEAPEVAGLDYSALGEDDVVNLIAQRSETIFDADNPGWVMKRWSAGDEGPIRDEVARRGDMIVRRAAGIIRAEYLELKPVLDELAPGSIADIGCGYALFDLFFAQDFPGQVVLIDLEESDARHFGYKETGAAYSSLAKAKALLVANGVSAKNVRVVNPDRDDLPKRKVNLAVSFLSCGFHYPVDTYADYFRDGVTAKGAVILDVRRRRVPVARGVLEPLGAVDEITESANGSAARLMLRKG